MFVFTGLFDTFINLTNLFSEIMSQWLKYEVSSASAYLKPKPLSTFLSMI